MKSWRCSWLGLFGVGLIIYLGFSLTWSADAASLAAFPCAEGFGSTTEGGRGGKILTVTNLNESGPGSFKAAVEVRGPRIVVFAVSGIIRLHKQITVSNPYLTIAGQTSPGGIALRGGPLVIGTHDVVVRGMRNRVGDDPDGSLTTSRDGISISSSRTGQEIYNVIVDHSSVSWGVDENMSTWTDKVHDVTFQWNISSEGLYRSIHIDEGASSPDPHSMGMLIGDYGRNISVHHNLFANNADRNPRLASIRGAEVVNNVMYNWGDGPTVVGGGESRAHIIGNYYKVGPQSSHRSLRLSDNPTQGTKVYLSGNYWVDLVGGQPGEYRDVIKGDQSVISSQEAFMPSNITVSAATDAYDLIVQYVGAFHPTRDSVDQRAVNSVINNSGQIIDSPSQVGGWPSYANIAPLADGDGDGMPDSWEISRGLNPALDDSANDQDGNGYTNVEDYLNNFYQDWCQASLSPTPGSPIPLPVVSITPAPTLVMVDTDGDGMPDGWEFQNGFDPTNGSDASGDADGDGINNLNEYFGRTDPHDSNDPEAEEQTVTPTPGEDVFAQGTYIHPGIDIRPPRSEANTVYVYTTHAGFVTYAGPAPPHIAEKGWLVQVETDLNRDNVADIITRYTHLSDDPGAISINNFKYKRINYTPDCFMSIGECLAPILGDGGGEVAAESEILVEKLPYGYGPYVARSQLIGMMGDTGSMGHRHVQYEIVTNRYIDTFGADLDTYSCFDDPYLEVCSTDPARPGFFFPINRNKENVVRGPVYFNPGLVTPAPAPTPITIE